MAGTMCRPNGRNYTLSGLAPAPYRNILQCAWTGSLVLLALFLLFYSES
jgi:hypothetical protein